MSPLNLLTQDSSFFFLWLMAIIYGITVHEFSHAFSAALLGDNTAQSQGRLTLNPLAHIDFFGLLMLLFVGFGWGRPVPFDPKNLKNERWGAVAVGLAGPLSNIISALAFSLLAGLFYQVTGATGQNLLSRFFVILIFLNIGLAFFNLLPIPPLDGSKLLLAILPDRPFYNFKIFLEQKGVLILLLLIILDRIININIFGFLFDAIWALAGRLI